VGDGTDYEIEEAYEVASLDLDTNIDCMEKAYKRAKAAKVGALVSCPVCGTSFRKKSYQQAFCRNKGRGNCKDRFWNLTDEERRDRALTFRR
jgi:hypothetical protein